MTQAGFTPVGARPGPALNPVVLGHVLVFAIGATSGLHLMNFTATGLSVVCLLLTPAFLLMTHRGVDLLPLVLAALGWIGFLISGAVNDVSWLWPNALAPAAFLLYLIGLTPLTGRSVDLITWVLAGISLGSVVFFAGHGIALTRTGSFLDLWKYGIAPGVTVLILFGLTLAGQPLRNQGWILLLLGLGSLALNYRSHALVCLLAGATLLVRSVIGDRIARGWQFVGILGFGLVFGNVMPALARRGLFGPALQTKILEQDTTHLPILLAGRTEPPMTITAIMERPWLGWGSAQRLTPDFYARAEHLAVRWGYDPNFPFEGYWRLPPNDYSFHSILLGSWAEGGIAALLLPAWLLVACLALVWNFTRFGMWGALVLTVALQGIWDLLYAPWMYNSPAVVACITLLFCAVHFRGKPAPQ